jgi:hypothetical protein
MGEKWVLKVLDNRVLTRVFEPNGKEVTDAWKTTRTEELHKLYPSQNIIRMIKKRQTEHVARIGAREQHGNL